MKKQLDLLWHTTNIYMHPGIHEFAEKLTAKLPGDLKVCTVDLHSIVFDGFYILNLLLT